MLYELFTYSNTVDPWTKPGAAEVSSRFAGLYRPRTALNVKVHERGEIEPLPGWKGIVSASVSEPRSWSAALMVTDQVPVRVSKQRVVTQLFTPDILTVPEYTPGGIAGTLRGPAASAVGAHTPIPTTIAMHPKSAPVTF